MFGTNQIVGKSAFKHLASNVLKVTSIFVTLQGEGPLGGRAVVFVRLAHCNLACSFCDTLFDQGDELTFEQIEGRIYEAVCDHWNKRGQHVPVWALKPPLTPEPDSRLGPYGLGLVITGGEPLLQDNLTAFLTRQAGQFDAIQIESNGTVEQPLDDGVILVCSPKCAEKSGQPTRYLKPSDWMLERANCLKFVMSADEFLPNGSPNPYHTIPAWAHQWKYMTGRDIYVSPMNVYNEVPQKIRLVRANKDEVTLAERSTVDETISFWEPGLLNMAQNQKNHEYAALYCLDHGLRLNLQMHLYASLP